QNSFQTPYIPYGSTWPYGNEHNCVYDPTVPHSLRCEVQGAALVPQAGAVESRGGSVEGAAGAAGLQRPGGGGGGGDGGISVVGIPNECCHVSCECSHRQDEQQQTPGSGARDRTGSGGGLTTFSPGPAPPLTAGDNSPLSYMVVQQP
ncbi:hypothetical protein Vretimale_13681, partial [Volvox reticuliferus]